MVSKPKRGRHAAAVVAAGKNRGGRRFLPDEVRRDTRIYVLTTASEHEELQGAAAHVGMNVSTWIRFVALERARAVAAEKEAARKRDEQ